MTDSLSSQSIITSAANEHVKYVRSLQRRRTRYQEQSFVIEGLRITEEALKAGSVPAFIFYTPQTLERERARALLRRAAAEGAQLKQVAPTIMSQMAETVTPSGILAVVRMAECALPRPLTWVLVIDHLRTPGNVGTILRSAVAAGVQLVLTTKGTVDVYNAKVVRGGMGAHFRLCLLPNRDWAEISNLVQGMQVVLAEPHEGVPYWEADWRQPTALIIGSEAHGASEEAQTLAGTRVVIPMQHEVESLNAAIAASLLLFEGARQRSKAGCNNS